MAHERRASGLFPCHFGRCLRVQWQAESRTPPFRNGTLGHAEGLCSGHAPCPFSLKRRLHEEFVRKQGRCLPILFEERSFPEAKEGIRPFRCMPSPGPSSPMLFLLHAERRERVCGHFQNSNPEMKASAPRGYGPGSFRQEMDREPTQHSPRRRNTKRTSRNIPERSFGWSDKRRKLRF